jgi:hypothetical protein
MKGGRIKEGFLSLETIKTCIVYDVYVCHSEGEWTRLKCLWTGYGSWCQAHQFVSRTAMLLDFSCSTVSRVYQEWSTIQRTSRQLDTAVGSIGSNMARHPCGTLSTHCRVHAPMNWGCSWGQKNTILGVLNVLYTHCSYEMMVFSQISWYNREAHSKGFWYLVFY